VNPDLDDIAAAFASGYFACAWLAGDRGESQLVGTGGFVATGDGRVEIRRMSVASGVRRQGIGATVLHHLIEIARARGVNRVVLETTDTWAEAMAFYERNGFQCFEERDGDAWFELALDLDADRGRGARGA
jgi:GNAT superfamily N-acetyltransferase